MWLRRNKVDAQRWEEMNLEVLSLIREERYDEALVRGRELLELGKKAFGKKHANTVTTLNNLGSILTILLQFDEAEACLLSALQLVEKLSGKICNETVIINRNLAKLYTKKAVFIKMQLTTI